MIAPGEVYSPESEDAKLLKNAVAAWNARSWSLAASWQDGKNTGLVVLEAGLPYLCGVAVCYVFNWINAHIAGSESFWAIVDQERHYQQ